MNISTDLSFKIRLKLFEKSIFSINYINQLLKTILLEFFHATENFELLRSKLIFYYFFYSQFVVKICIHNSVS